MKRRSPWALFIGAIPGAMPPLLGWTAIRGTIDPPAIALLAMQFLWQLPHFLAIAAMFKDDYERAGIQTFFSTSGPKASRFISASAAFLLIPFSLGVAHFGAWLTAGRATLGAGFVMATLVFSPRQLFLASVIYLPLLLGALWIAPIPPIQ